MHPAVVLLLFGRSLPQARPRLRPGVLGQGVTLARAQPGGAVSSAFGGDGAAQLYGVDAPRWNGPLGGLLLEEQRTNLIATARTPFGAGWTNNAGLAVTLGGATGPDGVAGSATLIGETGVVASYFGFSPNISVALGLAYALSVLVRPLGPRTAIQLFPSASRFGAAVYCNFDCTGDGVVSGSSGASNAAVTRIGDWYWCRASFVATSTGTGGVLGIAMLADPAAPRGAISYAGTTAQMAVAWAQTEAAAIASSPILPPAATPGAATRGADAAGFAVATPQRGTLVFAALPRQAAATADQVALQLDAGSDANRLLIRTVAGGNSVVLSRQTSGGAIVDAGAPLGNQVPGAPLSGWLSWDGSTARAQLRGGPVQSVAGVPVGLAQGRLGNRADGLRAWGGELLAVDELPVAISDAEGAALLSAWPW